MNIAYFLLPKSRLAYLYDDYTYRQGLEKMHNHGYTAIPVITRTGKYVGTVSEGDFLWHLVEYGAASRIHIKELEALHIRDILSVGKYPAVGITVSMEELLVNAMSQNFIPVVDDLENFVGIITRQTIIRYLADQKVDVQAALQRIV